MTFEQWLQSRLTAHGHPVGVNGDWGRVSIDALKAFQKKMGLPVTGVADRAAVDALKVDPDAPDASQNVQPPTETMPPWMAEMHRRMGLHEVTHKAKLIEFLKIGKFLGDPSKLPWCGDMVESCIAKVLPTEPLPANPFWAQAWATFGINAQTPLVGSIGVIRWSANAGHVGFVAGVEGNNVVLLGGNQSNAITLASFPRDKFIAFRWPKTFPVKGYPALRGKATAISSEGATR
jgi:uncharacterized protein (TIGR02594 family)